jgi:hypothetical protein
VSAAPALVAVPEHVPQAGAIIWWRLSGDVTIEEVRAEWSARGLPEGLLPTPPGPQAALTRAVNEHRTQHTLARPLGNRSGRALVHERVVSDELDYQTGVKVTLDALGRPRFDPAVHPLVDPISRSYAKHLDQLSTHDVGAWLVKLVVACDGIRLKDTGGVYFVPHVRLAAWRTMVQAIHATSAHRVNEVPALRAEDAVASILDALTAEAEAVAAELEQDLLEDLSAKKAGNRVARCEQTEAKVARYEALLGVKAAGLHERLDGLRAQLAVVAFGGGGFGEEVAS